jgi:hypothetical protein
VGKIKIISDRMNRIFRIVSESFLNPVNPVNPVSSPPLCEDTEEEAFETELTGLSEFFPAGFNSVNFVNSVFPSSPRRKNPLSEPDIAQPWRHPM